ncbi:hypothetical protein [Tortoise microvirus 81]|nr:hypothetical protein [Tortoise microvirus 81]
MWNSSTGDSYNMKTEKTYSLSFRIVGTHVQNVVVQVEANSIADAISKQPAEMKAFELVGVRLYEPRKRASDSAA